MKRFLALAALALLGACAAPPPPPPPTPPLAYPPSVRDRIFAVLEGEWREWGSITLSPGERGPQPPPEAVPDNFPRVLAYWRAVPDDEGIIRRNRGLLPLALTGQPDGEKLFREQPWSAAFISYVMLRAGVDHREFPPAPSHATYVDAIIKDAAEFPAEAPFMPRGPADYAPQPGDLVCMGRGAGPHLTHWRERLAETGRFRAMHCDIVVAVHPGWVEITGGNIADAVTRRRFPADERGVMLPIAGSPVFGVFENRLGRLGPWAPRS
jgi:hypothetical protein